MQNNKTIDGLIAALCAIIILVAYYGIEDVETKTITISLAAISLCIFLWLLNKNQDSSEAQIKNKEGKITEVVLLNEENNSVSTWDIFGKTSLVIGKDIKENHVDINLNNTVYAGMIEIEHAVLNFSGGNWYIEDLYSKNGIVLQKSFDQRKYKLTTDQPCKIDKGDVIILGLTKLEVR